MGSGDRPMSAVDMMPDQLVRRPPGELDESAQLELVAQRHQLVEAVPRPIRVKAMSSRLELLDHDVGRPDDDVHPVLRAHHADVGGEVRPPAPQLEGRPRRLQPSGSGPVRTTVTGRACRLASIAISRYDSLVEIT